MNKEIKFYYNKPDADPNSFDYEYHFRIFLWYLNLFRKPQFSIPYFKTVDSIDVAMSFEVDLTAMTYQDVLYKMKSIETEEGFLGFQVPNE